MRELSRKGVIDANFLPSSLHEDERAWQPLDPGLSHRNKLVIKRLAQNLGLNLVSLRKESEKSRADPIAGSESHYDIIRSFDLFRAAALTRTDLVSHLQPKFNTFLFDNLLLIFSSKLT